MRLLTATAKLTCENGWSSVTMGKVAARVGVSRQTVYKELGSKPELAEALMLRETDGFAAGVAQTISAYPDDAVEGVTAAFQYALESARDNPLLKSALAGDGLLPLSATPAAAEPPRAARDVHPARDRADALGDRPDAAVLTREKPRAPAGLDSHGPVLT